MKFNTHSTTQTTNFAGAIAYSQTPELELVSILLTSFVEDKFYESAQDQLVRLRDLIDRIPNKEFIAKAAIYARHEFGMRSITHVIAGELCMRVKNEVWLKDALTQIICRPDDILEIVAYYLGQRKVKGNLPAALRKAICSALSKFDRYQLAKYRGGDAKIKMVDIFNMVHPKPTKDQEFIFKDLMSGNLVSTETWESKLSKAGQDGKTADEVRDLKKDAWIELIKTKKIGYFALLRNLRNIINQAPEAVPAACELLTDAKFIAYSKIFPFNFMTAFHEITTLVNQNAYQSMPVLRAINEAMTLSVSNVPVFSGTNLIALDVSGSMTGKPLDIGSLFAALLFKKNESDILLFSDKAQYIMPGLSIDSLATLTTTIKAYASLLNGGTDFNLIFKKCNKRYDRIFILSDMQAWKCNDILNSNLKQYKSSHDADPYIYSFDLAGYGSMQFPERNVFAIAGFSDKIFGVIKLLETDKNALIKKINSIEI